MIPLDKQIGSIHGSGKIELDKKERGILLSKLNKWNEDGLERIKFKLKKWSLIRSYIHGNDWGERGSAGNRRTAAQRLVGGYGTSGNPDEEPYTNNVMMRIHMSNMQRIGRYQPKIEVEPKNSDLNNKQAARFGEAYLYELLEKQKYKSRLRRKIDRLISLTGAVYMKVMVDPTAGENKVKPNLDSFGKVESWESNEADQCGVILDVLAPKNLVLPPYCTDITEADYAIENNVRTTDYVLRKYGVSVKSQDISAEDALWWRSGQGDDRSADTPVAEKKEGLCIVKEAFVMRGEEFPLGAHVIWSGDGKDDVIIKSTVLDDFYPGLPYFKAEFIYDDEDIDGETPYWFMIPMQNALNRVESDIRSHSIMMCKPKWQQHTETILQNPDGITNKTAQVLKWTGTHAPGIISGADLPQTVFTWRDMVLGEMMSIGAAHDIVRPKQPRSGTAIAYEQEQDDTTLAPTIESIGVMHEEAFSFALKLRSDPQYFPEALEHSYRSGKGLVVSKTFDGGQLNGNFKVRVNMQSGLPSNKIARQQLVVQLKNQGIITADVAQRYFEFGEADEALQKTLVAYERAQKLVEFLKAGGQYADMPAMEFDDHVVTVQELKAAMQECWEEEQPHVKEQLLLAYRAHVQALIPAVAPVIPGMKRPAEGAPNEMPTAPPGMRDSGQEPGQQPRKPEGSGESLYSIPGMEEPVPAMAGG